jgi:hypothetical protein
MNKLLDYKLLIPLVLLLGLAPFLPQPHIVEKISMIMSGSLRKPIDIFDLVWHSWPFALLGYRLILDVRKQTRQVR